MGLLGKLFGNADTNTKAAGQGSAQSASVPEPAPKPMVPSERLEDLVAEIKAEAEASAFALHINPEQQPTLTSSKLGGLPYWPRGLAYPEPVRQGLSSDERLALLAQLNLADFGGDPRLPDHGLLQFFITTDDLMGLEFDVPMDAQRHFRVVWHETVDPTVTAEDVLSRGIAPAGKGEIFPVRGEHALSVEPTTCWMTPGDVRFDRVFHEACTRLFGDGFADMSRFWADYLEDEDCDRLGDLLNEGGYMSSMVLGYPFFTQYDPRGEDNVADFDTLLLQVDSDLSTPSKVMWGDSGVGNFFINGEALAKGDFSHVDRKSVV